MENDFVFIVSHLVYLLGQKSFFFFKTVGISVLFSDAIYENETFHLVSFANEESNSS